MRSRLVAGAALSAGVLLTGCGGEATVVGQSQPAVAPAAAAAAPAPARASTPAPAAPARSATPDRGASRSTLRTASGGRADSAEVAGRRAVRDRRVALGLPASPSPDPDRTATVQVLGVDPALPGLAALVRDALAEAFPSETAPLLLRGETADAPPVVLLADLENPADAAGAAEFLTPAEPVAGPEAEDFAISRTAAVRVDAAALLDDWLTEAGVPTPAAVLTLRVPSVSAARGADGEAGDAERTRRASVRSSENPFNSNPFGGGEAADRPVEAPAAPATTAEAVRRDAFALGPDGDPDTPDTRTAGWTVGLLPRPDEAPAARDAAGSNRSNRRDAAEAAARAAAEPEPTAYLIVAGPVEDPAAWLSAARRHLPQSPAAATFPPPASAAGQADLPNVLAATAESGAGPRTLPPPADGDAVGWAFDLTARQNASGGGPADAAPAPGEAPRDWALRAIESGSPEARRTAARFLSAVSPAPDAEAPEEAGAIRDALLAAMPEQGGDAQNAPAGPNEPVGRPLSEDNPFRRGNDGGEPFGGGGSGSSGAGFSPDLFSALLRWSFTSEQYAEAGQAAAASGPPQESTVAAVVDRIEDDPAAAAALAPLADVPGAAERVVGAVRQPGAPAEPAALALLEAETLEVRREAAKLLAEVGASQAAADRLAAVARWERDRDLAKEMRAARIPILARIKE
ncbi:hypothetical protein [Alienimonas sp. DA493]|uniref:hypothetical protein n=1 Tax=Alienimonas sp. DA493 TaxID=3373605 RepID=UPI0037552729